MAAALFVGGAVQLSIINACEDTLVGFTRIFDPCGTVLSNCAPGSFYSNDVEIGSAEARCWDPACTIPGQCDAPPLGTIRDPCD